MRARASESRWLSSASPLESVCPRTASATVENRLIAGRMRSRAPFPFGVSVDFPDSNSIVVPASVVSSCFCRSTAGAAGAGSGFGAGLGFGAGFGLGLELESK